jgi:aspartate racemase
MKTIGILGGMSWESSALYYQIINEATHARLGGQHNARSVMVTVDFDEIETLQHADRWDEAAVILHEACLALERAGADMILIATNTMHKLLPRIRDGITIPFIHIAQATADAISERGLKRIGLLGTRFTMEEDFYKQILIDNGIDVVIPDAAERDLIHKVIYDELCLGAVKDASKHAYLDIIARMEADDAIEGVILGCTEIGMLISQDDVSLPVFDTTRIHALSAVEEALKGD